MKNLFYSLCLLIGFSSTAQSIDFQINNINSSKMIFTIAANSISTIFFNDNEEAVAIVEKDTPFDFDTANYLPVGFNATLVLDASAYEAACIEEDAPFDFNTANHLPVGFNATLVLDTDEYEAANIEEDEAFDFNTADYLPKPIEA